MAANYRRAEQRAQEDPTLEPRILDSTRALPGAGPGQDEMYGLVARFVGETNIDVDAAWKYLMSAGWKFHLALEAFYNTEPQESELTDMENQDLEGDMEDLEGDVGDQGSDMEATEISVEMTDLESEEEAGEVGDQRTVTDKSVSFPYLIYAISR